MSNREPEGSIMDPSREGEGSEVNLKDEIYKQQQQMAEIYQAWAKGNPPPPYSANLAFIPPLAQSQELPTADSSPGFPTYHHYHGTTSQTPQAPPPKPVPDRSSLTQMEKKSKGSFGDYWFRWNEQVARDGPPMDRIDVAEPRQRHDPVGLHSKRFHPQYRPSGYNSPQHYYPPPGRNFFQISNQPPTSAQWRAPVSQNAYLPSQAYRSSPGSGFRPNQAFNNERLQKKKTFTPIGESYASMFQRLRQLGVLKPIQIKPPNPLAKKLDFSQRCAYCSNAPGHSTEGCWHLKKAIQKLIDIGDIVVQNLDATDTSQSPSLVHYETYMVGMVCFEKEYGNSSEILRGPRAPKRSTLSGVDLENKPAIGTQKQFVKSNVGEACENSSNVNVEPSG